ncbi:four helix bundle protein [Fodinibius salsisoli]|uniref:Four helix bundle protein n=1 Tax=Fodinibius salsisoli TaxID=2820877 RepID=A0ABT3PN86_9BACT|nr:four helix bundle protein [Fodinibius salsisoli]MCW9707397.1 four helix bundle protein [Fodinibius salsisoli]
MREGFKDLKVYKLAYQCANEIFEITKNFPKAERYALTDQIRRSSRSICANIAEGYRKRIYPNHFRSKISDADAECSETLVWLDFSKDCRYIPKEKHEELLNRYQQIGKMLGIMIQNPKKFLPKGH